MEYIKNKEVLIKFVEENVKSFHSFDREQFHSEKFIKNFNLSIDAIEKGRIFEAVENKEHISEGIEKSLGWCKCRENKRNTAKAFLKLITGNVMLPEGFSWCIPIWDYRYDICKRETVFSDSDYNYLKYTYVAVVLTKNLSMHQAMTYENGKLVRRQVKNKVA